MRGKDWALRKVLVSVLVLALAVTNVAADAMAAGLPVAGTGEHTEAGIVDGGGIMSDGEEAESQRVRESENPEDATGDENGPSATGTGEESEPGNGNEDPSESESNESENGTGAIGTEEENQPGNGNQDPSENESNESENGSGAIGTGEESEPGNGNEDPAESESNESENGTGAAGTGEESAPGNGNEDPSENESNESGNGSGGNEEENQPGNENQDPSGSGSPEDGAHDGSGSQEGTGNTPGNMDANGTGTQDNTATPAPGSGQVPEEDSGEEEDFSDLMPIEELTALPEDMVGATMWKGAAAFALAVPGAEPGEGTGTEPDEDIRPKGDDWDFGIRYSYQTDEENSMVIKGDANVKYDMTFHTEIGLPAGTVEIRIPVALFRYRGTLEAGTFSQAAGDLVTPAENDIAVPKAPGNDPGQWTYSRNTAFNYYISNTDESGSPTEDSELVFFNYRKISAGTNAMWQVLYRGVDIMRSVDGTEWGLQAQALVTRKNADTPESPDGTAAQWKEAASSAALTGVVDSSVNISGVTKKAHKENGKQFTPGLYTEAQVRNYISGDLPEEFGGENFNNWKYTVWDVTVQGNATQPWTMELAENPSILNAEGTEKPTNMSDFRVVGYRNNTNTSYPLLVEEGKAFEIKEVPQIPTESEGEQPVAARESLTAALKESCTEKNPRMRFFLVLAYPADAVETGDLLANDLSVTFRPLDGKDNPAQKEASASHTYADYNWTYSGDQIIVHKYSDIRNETEKRYDSWLEAYSQAQGAGQDYGSLWFSSEGSYTGYGSTHYVPSKDQEGSPDENGALHGYREGSCYELATADDFLYATYDGRVEGVNGPVKLDWNDYYYSGVKVTQTDSGYDSANESVTSGLEFPDSDRGVYIYAMFGKPAAEGEAWTEEDRNSWVMVNGGQPVSRSGGNTASYSFTREEIAREPWRVMAVHGTAEHTTACTIEVNVCLKASPSETLMKIMEAYRKGTVESMELRNFSAALGRYRTEEDGEWQELSQMGTDSFYQQFGSTFPIEEDTKAFYGENSGRGQIYTYAEGTLPVRGSASVTLYGLEKEARSYKRAKTTNDVAGNRVLVDYYLTAYDGYLVYDKEGMGYLRNMGIASPGRKYVMFYDLLPYGVTFDPSVEVVAGRITQLDHYGYYRERTNYWDEKDVTVTTEVTDDWMGTGRDMVTFRLEYAEDDPSIYTDGKWVEGWGVSFRAYYAWNDKEQVEKQYNISAFMPDVEKYAPDADTALRGETEGNYKVYQEGTVPERDPETGAAGGYKPFGKGINPANAGREANILYAACLARDDQAIGSGSVIHKEVRADSDTFVTYGDSAYVEEGKGYTYKITVETPQAGLKDLVVFDHLENAAVERAGRDDQNSSYFTGQENRKWYGTFRKVNFAGLEGLGVKPQVWYNTARNAATTKWMPSGDDGLQMTELGTENTDKSEIPVTDILNPDNGYGWYQEEEFIQNYKNNLTPEELAGKIGDYRDSHSRKELDDLERQYREDYPEAGDVADAAITRALAMETVGSVAVDLRNAADGKEFVLSKGNALSFEIEMRAPAGEEDTQTGENTIFRYAFNNPSYYSVPVDDNGIGRDGVTLDGGSVRVRLGAGHALEVRKSFRDVSQVPEMFREESFRFRVYRETEERDADGNIILDGETGKPVMVPAPLANKAYTLWNLIPGENGAEDSYVQVQDRPYASDEQGYFTLKAGQRAVFDSVADAEHVIVEEEENLFWKPEDDEYDNEKYPDNNKVSGLNTYLHDIKNTYRNVLYVRKNLENVPEDIKETLTEADKTFSFRIRLKDENGEYQPASLEYCLVDSVRLNGYSPEILDFPGNDGNGDKKFRKTGEDGSFTIREGWILAFVLEKENTEYELTEVYDTDENGSPVSDMWMINDPVTGVVPVRGASQVITNRYKWREFCLTKEIANQDPEDCTEIFTFELQKRQEVQEKDADGNVTGTKWEWVPVDGTVDNNTWTLVEKDKGPADSEEGWETEPQPDETPEGTGTGETGDDGNQTQEPSVPAGGIIGSDGRFSAQCAEKVIRIGKLEAGAVYRILEIRPDSGEEWDYRPGKLEGGTFVPLAEGEGIEFTMPVYGDKAEETIVNQYLRRPLSVTKTVLSDDVADVPFTMILAQGTGDDFRFLANREYRLLENGRELTEWDGQGSPVQHRTDEMGRFFLKTGQTAVFEDLGKEGEKFVVWEVQEDHEGKKYPQLSPAGTEEELTLGDSAVRVTVGAPMEITFDENGGSGEFLNGSPGLLVLDKEYEAQKWPEEWTEASEELAGMAGRVDELKAMMQGPDQTAEGKEKIRWELFALAEETDRVNWRSTALDVRVHLKIRKKGEESWTDWNPWTAGETQVSITCIQKESGIIYRIEPGSEEGENTWRILRKQYGYNDDGTESSEFEWRDTDCDAEAILAFDSGSFNINPRMSYAISVGEDTEYELEEVDPFYVDLTEKYVISPRVPGVSGNVNTSPAATLRNEIRSWEEPEIEKQMTPGSHPVGSGKELVWRVERYSERTGSWNAAEGVEYIIMEGRDEDRYCSSPAIQKTGRDGKIVLSRDRDENTYLAVQFLEERVFLNLTGSFREGGLRLVELTGPGTGTDEAWGTLVGYSTEELAGRYDMGLDWNDATILVNSNQKTKVRVEKRTEKPYHETFTMFLRQNTNNIGYISRPGMTYTVYDSDSGSFVRDDKTGSGGEILLEDGQYAELELPGDAEWSVSEAEDDDPGTQMAFRLGNLQKENDADGILQKAGDNLMLIERILQEGPETNLTRDDVNAGGVTKVTRNEDGTYGTEWVPLYKEEQGYDVEIPEYILQNGIVYHVTGIGEEAFRRQEGVRSVKIPHSVRSIGKSAFAVCTSLESINIPAGVTEIEESVFHECGSLQEISLPESVKTIGKSAFYYCENLKTIEMPGVREIGELAFANCSGLTEVNLPASLEVIGKSAFERCTGLEKLTLPENLKDVYYYAFAGAGLKEVTVLSDVIFHDYAGNEAGAENAFGWDNEVEVLVIDGTVNSVGRKYGNAFRQLKELVIGENGKIETIESQGFAGHQNLQRVTIHGKVEAIGQGAFKESSLTGLVIDGTVGIIGTEAFQNCRNLKNVTINGSVGEIRERAYGGAEQLTTLYIAGYVRQIYGYAFTLCPNLKEVFIYGKPDGMEDAFATSLFLGEPPTITFHVGWNQDDDPAGRPWGASEESTMEYGWTPESSGR